MRIAHCLALLLALAAVPAAAKPQVTRIDPPKNILFIGNSFSYYNNSLHGHLRLFWRTADPAAEKSMVFKSYTVSGGYLREHAATLPEALRFRMWDVVILQGQSSEPMEGNKNNASFKEHARAYDKLIREASARTALYMTWAYRDKPEMTAALAGGYEGMGNELGALVVPVGLAFERALGQRPGLVLHIEDKQHPTLAGTYLAAATFYAALWGKTPVGHPYTAGLEPELAKFLQGVAWETVRAYYGG